MAMTKRRVANPAPAVLALVNPKGQRKMAAKKRHSTGRPKAANPKRKSTAHKTAHKTSTALAKTHHATASKRRVNPPTKRHTSHKRRNPSGGGIAEEALNFSIGGFTLGLVQPIVRSWASRVVGSGPIAAAGVTAVTGYGLGVVAGHFSLTRRLERPLKVLGISMAITQLATSFVIPMLRGGSASAPANPQQGLANYRRGMNGIAVVTSVPPGIVAPAAIAPARAAAAGSASSGMNGIATLPGRFGRGR